MRISKPLVFSLVAACAMLLATPDAEARRGRGRGGDRFRDRIELVEAPTSPFSAAEARIRIESRDASRQELRVSVEGAPAGLDLRIRIADAQGAMTEVGAMEEELAGEYQWRLRSKKGDALPFGVAELSALSGRKIEVRTAAGEIAYAATLPDIPTAAAPRGLQRKGLRSGLAAGSGAALLGLEGIEARIKVRIKRPGDESFEVSVEDAPAGTVLEIWIADPVTGEMTFIASMGEPLPTAKRGGDDDSDDDEDGDDDGDDDDDGGDDGDDDDGLELEYEVETEDGDVLPFGVASVADLSGLRLELRAPTGEIAAEGVIPAVGAGRDDGDDDDGDDGEDEQDDKS